MNNLNKAASPDPDSHHTSESFKYEDMLAQCIYPDDAERLHETCTKVISGTSVYELEHQIMRHGAFSVCAKRASTPCTRIRTTR